MSASSVTIETTSDVGTMDQLLAAIAAREKELGETTEHALHATAIKILKSLRAGTLKANPKKYDEVAVTVAGEYVSGWYHGRRVAYPVGSPGKNHENARNLAGAYVRGEWNHPPKVFRVKEKFWGEYLVVAKSLGEVKKYANEKHRKRVECYAGMARYIFGPAMQKISTLNDNSEKTVTGKARTTALKNLIVNSTRSGFGSGTASVEFYDLLNYAETALVGGASALELAMQKACNSTIGMINKSFEKLNLQSPYKVPFPEIANKT